jgi:hypothetical protein
MILLSLIPVYVAQRLTEEGARRPSRGRIGRLPRRGSAGRGEDDACRPVNPSGFIGPRTATFAAIQAGEKAAPRKADPRSVAAISSLPQERPRFWRCLGGVTIECGT